MLFQILIFVFSLVAISSIFVHRVKKNLSIQGIAFWILFWLGVDLVVIFPNSTTIVANKLGIGRGTDLIVYISIIAIFYLLFRLQIKIEGINRDITKIVRNDAIDSYKKK